MLSRLSLPVYPSSPKAPWISIQTAIPTAVGSTMASSVHRRLPVSRRMVRQVVPQGKCSRHRAIIHRAVSVVQPLCSKMARSASSPLHSVSVPVCR